ncbi:MAG: AAA family ATPase, partial [Bacteroidetes bacterium]|nr:AAA family ATPase [Bacteroidota bacterium]
ASVQIPGLNEQQAAAVASALGRDTTFIWGPPGTGKTATIGHIGSELYARDRSLLLVSPVRSATFQERPSSSTTCCIACCRSRASARRGVIQISCKPPGRLCCQSCGFSRIHSSSSGHQSA